MATAALSPTRAMRRPRRIDLRAVLGVILMLLAMAGSAVVWSTLSDTRPVVVATRDVPAGAVLSASDVSIARLRLDDTLYQAAIPGDSAGSLVGKQLAEPVHAHQILVQSQLSPRQALAPGQVAMTIPVTAESAVGGGLHPGDAVEVLETVSKGKPDSKTSVVLPRAAVYSVGYDQQSTVINTSGSQASTPPAAALKSITLRVTPDQASALAQARWNADLDVVLLAPAQAGGAQ